MTFRNKILTSIVIGVLICAPINGQPTFAGDGKPREKLQNLVSNFFTAVPDLTRNDPVAENGFSSICEKLKGNLPLGDILSGASFRPSPGGNGSSFPDKILGLFGGLTANNTNKDLDNFVNILKGVVSRGEGLFQGNPKDAFKNILSSIQQQNIGDKILSAIPEGSQNPGADLGRLLGLGNNASFNPDMLRSLFSQRPDDAFSTLKSVFSPEATSKVIDGLAGLVKKNLPPRPVTGNSRKKRSGDKFTDRNTIKGALGTKCASERDCTSAFSTCIDGICGCANGFDTNIEDNFCEPTQIYCPFGSPTKSDGALVSCTRRLVEHPLQIRAVSAESVLPAEIALKWVDSCPSGSYCSTQNYELPLTTMYGFCCPRPEPMCPMGKPLTGVNCGLDLPDSSSQEETESEVAKSEEERTKPPRSMCPSRTHYCHMMSISGVATPISAVCCPRACKNAFLVNVDGICVPMARVGGECQFDEQCITDKTECREGQCVCKKGLVERFEACHVEDKPVA